MGEKEISLKTATIIADHLEKMVDEIRELVKENTVARIAKVDELRALFPKDLEEMLTFEESGEYFLAKPRQFLGSENFAKIAAY